MLHQRHLSLITVETSRSWPSVRIVMALACVSYERARELLRESDGDIERALHVARL